MLVDHSRWSDSEIATLAYGYGFQVSPLQLAQAYMVYANGGIYKPVSLLKVDETDEVPGVRVISADVAASVTQMLEAVVTPGGGGTGTRAYIPTHRVAGKTGTAWYYDVQRGGYDDENYISLFAGFAPVSDPKIVTVVTIHEPQGKEYGGGQVAAPVFANITAGALRILNVPPDIIPEESEVLSLKRAAARPSLAWSRRGRSMNTAKSMSQEMTLGLLLESKVEIPEKYNLVLTGIEMDSRKIESGDLFIACKGANFDGTRFC